MGIMIDEMRRRTMGVIGGVSDVTGKLPLERDWVMSRFIFLFLLLNFLLLWF